jgi:hypothetical protein
VKTRVGSAASAASSRNGGRERDKFAADADLPRRGSISIAPTCRRTGAAQRRAMGSAKHHVGGVGGQVQAAAGPVGVDDVPVGREAGRREG